ncbi:MAG: M3 family metallopeptidase [Deltaproteobacteria bacterium]|nr:M3 family metallopeptidase [Deltaproteobacteria bacterium]
MHRFSIPIAVLTLVAAANACKTTTEATATPQVTTMDNVLLAPWTGPHGGVPAFEAMELAALEPAMKEAMRLHLAELDTIAANPEPPTFDNTIVAMERAGAVIRRVETYYGIWSSNMSTPEFREVEGRLAPAESEYRSAITQNEALFARVKAVKDDPKTAQRSPAEQRLVSLIYDRFARRGAMLEGAAKDRYAEIQRRLAELHTAFGNNVLADEEGYVSWLTEDQLSGLPDSFKAAAASLAESRGQPGKYAITNTRSSMDPFLTYSDERGLREQVWRNYYGRGDNGDAHDNNAIIAEILVLRDERVALLGYDNYAQWRLEDRMAGTPERAMALMEAVWPSAVARVKEEVADMQAIADRDKAGITIEPWDYRYYADKVRKDKYALDSDEIKQYLQLDKLREAMFMVAGRLFGFVFTPLPDGEIPVFHPDVKVWEVTDATSGDHIGLWYLDPFARTGKRSGAWASSYRGHTTFDGKQTVLSSNNSNFIKGAAGQPVLISWDDAQTFFHEFGHALHALSSRVEYRTLNGGVRDYTEFQSQLLERWLFTQPVIDSYLVHHKTGAPMPAELVAKIKKAATFNQGFSTVEYLASALMDLKFHTVDPKGIDPDAFERETLAALGMPSQLVMRHRSPHFSHVFSGEGYSAGYYGYMWADVLTADAAEAFAASPGGFYDEGMAAKLVDHLFAPRNAVDPAEAYRAFRGRDAQIEALMRDRGFPVPKR